MRGKREEKLRRNKEEEKEGRTKECTLEFLPQPITSTQEVSYEISPGEVEGELRRHDAFRAHAKVLANRVLSASTPAPLKVTFGGPCI